MSLLDNVKRMTVGNQPVRRIQVGNKVLYWRPRTFTIRAKPWPYDYQQPVACIEEDGVQVTDQFSRDWYFFVWDENINEWSLTVDHSGARLVESNVKIPTARYDTYDAAIRAAQQQAFCDGIDRIPNGTRILIVANHWAGNHNAAMRNRIIHCGGTQAKLSWSDNSSYILVGKVGVGSGNGFHEVLNNITYNGVSNCAEVTFTW